MCIRDSHDQVERALDHILIGGLDGALVDRGAGRGRGLGPRRGYVTVRALRRELGTIGKRKDAQLRDHPAGHRDRSVGAHCDFAGRNEDRLARHGEHRFASLGDQLAVRRAMKAAVSRVARSVRRLHHEESLTFNRQVQRVACGLDRALGHT